MDAVGVEPDMERLFAPIIEISTTLAWLKSMVPLLVIFPNNEMECDSDPALSTDRAPAAAIFISPSTSTF